LPAFDVRPSEPSYSGVETNFGGWPGTVVPVALPPSVDTPCLPEPGADVVAVEPALPIASAGSLGRPFNDAGGATVMIGSVKPGDCGAVGPTDDGVCAMATPVIIARAVVAVSQNLSMLSPPGAYQATAFARSHR
jgi:hypothetical protein